jgi:hypothetical protein
MDFGGFEVGTDGGLHRDDVVVTAKAIDEGSKVRKNLTVL